MDSRAWSALYLQWTSSVTQNVPTSSVTQKREPAVSFVENEVGENAEDLYLFFFFFLVKLMRCHKRAAWHARLSFLWRCLAATATRAGLIADRVAGLQRGPAAFRLDALVHHALVLRLRRRRRWWPLADLFTLLLGDPTRRDDRTAVLIALVLVGRWRRRRRWRPLADLFTLLLGDPTRRDDRTAVLIALVLVGRWRRRRRPGSIQRGSAGGAACAREKARIGSTPDQSAGSP